MRLLLADTLLVSDIHLGSPLSRVRQLWDVLEAWDFKRLIIIGDLFATSNLKELSEFDWDFLLYLSSRQQQGSEIVWVEGNHDEGVHPLSHLLGFPIYPEYQWYWGSRACLAIHGHQFDFIIDSLFSTFISWLYLQLLKIQWVKKRCAEAISKTSTHLQNITADVRKGCLKTGSDRGMAYVFAGHTHHHEIKTEGTLRYINTGCWVDHQATLVSLNEDGTESIFFY